MAHPLPSKIIWLLGFFLFTNHFNLPHTIWQFQFFSVLKCGWQHNTLLNHVYWTEFFNLRTYHFYVYKNITRTLLYLHYLHLCVFFYHNFLETMLYCKESNDKLIQSHFVLCVKWHIMNSLTKQLFYLHSHFAPHPIKFRDEP